MNTRADLIEAYKTAVIGDEFTYQESNGKIITGAFIKGITSSMIFVPRKYMPTADGVYLKANGQKAKAQQYTLAKVSMLDACKICEKAEKLYPDAIVIVLTIEPGTWI